MVSVTTRSCNLYTRMWCVYEMSFALRLGVKVVMSQCVHYSEDCGFLDTFSKQCKEPINSRLAKCGSPDDEKLIRAEIESVHGGYDAVDVAVEVERIRTLLSRSFESAVQEARKLKRHDGQGGLS